MWRRAALAGAAALSGASRATAPPPGSRPRVVVLGTGWAAFAFLRTLERGAFDVAVVSPRNHMLFTPLLSSTAAGAQQQLRISSMFH
jgi:NADH:ubiquinone reductase (non-electrogenic)